MKIQVVLLLLFCPSRFELQPLYFILNISSFRISPSLLRTHDITNFLINIQEQNRNKHGI